MNELSSSAAFVLALADPTASLERVGGKGVSLAQLAQAGLPVPGGFHVTTTAYERFVADNDLRPVILETLRAVDLAQSANLQAVSRSIGDRFLAGSISQDVARAIDNAYADLPGDEPFVAVRSSATAEDLPDRSFAGQLETYLNVHGLAAVQDAIKRCWASLWTDRAIGYRYNMAIDQDSISMGVVVQVMVPADVAGVLFTANPTTGVRDELVVNASIGLGEAVVSGLVTPDSFVVDKPSLSLKHFALGTKEVTVLPAQGQGTLTERLPTNRRNEQSLSEPQLKQLGELAVRVERAFGGIPLDIEWAIADGRIWLLQARPMTGLPPALLKDVKWESPIPGAKWVRRQVVENMPEPLSPLFDELYLTEGMDLAMDKLAELAGYGDLLGMAEHPWYATVNGYAYLRGSFRFTWDIARKLMVALFGGKTMRAVFVRAIPRWRDEMLPAHLRTIERWKAVDPQAAPDAELLDGIRELARAEAVYWAAASAVMAAARGSDMALDVLLSVAMPRSGLHSALLLRGFPSRAIEAEAELQAIAAEMRGSDELRELVKSTPAQRLLDALQNSRVRDAPSMARLEKYLDRYGHRVYNLDFVEPTQAEDPTPVMMSLKSQVLQPGRDVNTRRAEIDQERDRLIDQTARSIDPLRRRLFLKVLGWARRLAPYREEALFYVGSAWPVLRRLALESGRRLADVGSLNAPADVFFLYSGELLQASTARSAGESRPDLARLARERRELREARKRLHPPAAVPPAARWQMGPFDLSRFETQKRNLDQGSTLHGFAVSPGRVTGRASVILSPADFRTMESETILVCPTTTPAWTPLFAQARGLVTDIGGVGAHGSIVAREYGIPAVMGTGVATRRIHSGDVITVDGGTGVVTLPTKGR